MAPVASTASSRATKGAENPPLQTTPACFAVRGYGERVPASVRLADESELDAAIAICTDEMALIDAAIAADRIPRPAALENKAPRFDIRVEPLAPEAADLRFLRYPPADLLAADGGSSRLLSRLGTLLRRAGVLASPDAGPRNAEAPVPSDANGPWPKISIVAVSFNQAQYLEASIRSVLDQNYPNLEYIVVDGGSTDGSVDIIERYRDRCDIVIIEPDRGQSDALNKGFSRATGNVMNWLCSDDLLEPGALFEIGHAFARHGADVIAGGCVRIGERREEHFHLHHTRLPLGETVRLAPLDVLHFMRSWQSSNYFFQPEVFFSRRVWEASGGYIKEHLYYAMDYDLWLRMALAGATAHHVPATIGCSRIHAAQKTQADRKYLHQMRALMDEYRDLFVSLKSSAPMS